MKTDIGISDRNRRAVVGILNCLLADEHVLYLETRNFHWNVTGPDFGELHKFFQSQYEELSEIIDGVAERARALGGRAMGSLKEFSEHARLKENPGAKLNARKMVASLLTGHESVIRSLRGDLGSVGESWGDLGTNDFLTGLMERHEKMAWMLRAYLE